jgi:histidinol-phosphate aminotransferase
MRITCVPQKDTIMSKSSLPLPRMTHFPNEVCPPTYGMYSVCAIINDVGVVKVPLDCKPGSFQPQVDKVRSIDVDCTAFHRGAL